YQSVKKISIAALIVLAIGINVLAPILAWQWMQLPFLGVLLEHTLVISDVYNSAWPARQMGLQNPDMLQAINNTPVSTSRDVIRALKPFAPGDRVMLSAKQGDPPTVKEVSVPLIKLTWPDFYTIFAIPYIIGIFYLALGLFVYRLRASDRAGEVFAVFCALVSIFTGAFFNVYTYHNFTALWTLSLPMISASLMHLALVFPIETRLIKKRPWLRFAPYAPAVALALVAVASLYNRTNPTAYFIPWRLEFGFVSLGIVFFFVMLLMTWYISFSPLVRQQARIIFWGSVTAFAPILVWTATSLLGYNIPFGGWVYLAVFAPLVLFPLSVAFAILRYQLLDLDTVARYALLYAGLTAIVLAGFAGVVGLLRAAFQIPAPSSNPVVLSVYGLALVVLLGPLRDWLGGLINHLFFAAAKNYQAILQTYTAQLATMPLNVDGILNLYLQKVQEGVQTHKSIIFFVDPKAATFDVRLSRPDRYQGEVVVSYLASDSLPGWLARHKEPLRFNPDGHLLNRAAVDREEIARLVMLSLRVVIPLFGTEKLLGWLGLGDKVSGLPYNQSDLTFLTNLGAQTTIALENAQLFEVANRKTEELLALQETNLDIASEQDTGRILTSVVQRATHLLEAKGGSIYLLDLDYGRLKNEICFNLDPEYAATSFSIGEGIAGGVVLQGRPQLVGNYKSVAGQVEIYPGDDFGPVVAVPFAWKGHVRGVLELIRDARAPHFSQADADLLQIMANQAAIALESARLLKEANSKATQLATLNEVNRVISATLQRETALKLVMEEAVKILRAEAGSIFLVDDTEKFLTFEVALGPTGVELVGAKIPIDMHSIAGSIAATREPLIVNNVAKDPRWNTSFDEATEFHTRDILGVPMLAFNQVVGVIEVINKQDGRRFTNDDLTTLTIFAGQAAIAIVNAERFTQTDQALAGRVRELNTLELIDRELNATLDLKTVLHLTVSSTMDFVGASVGLLALINDEGTGLHFKTMVGVAQKYRRYSHTPWPLERGVIGRVATGGQAMLAEGDRLDNFSSDGRSTSQLCMPIVLKDEVIGIISLERAGSAGFTTQDRDFAMRLASHASLAIQNARLFEAVKAANQAKTEFMSVASHELKIPMTSIKGYAKMLEMVGGDSFTDQQKEFVRIITANTNRMNRLVSDLLDVSRIEAGRIKLEMEHVSINDVVQEVTQLVDTQIKAKELHLNVDIPPHTPPVWADHGRLVQVLTNLVSNAYKYTPQGGRINVKARQTNGQDNNKILSVCVSDTGYGISPEDQEQLFSKFFRSADQNIRDVRGTGLGLAITRSLVEMHGGTMWFESTLGKGSTFGFDLPLTPQKTSPA
ncbi:MAG: GAF domain-containing protein, partial [Anaerolineae bacterium]